MSTIFSSTWMGSFNRKRNLQIIWSCKSRKICQVLAVSLQIITRFVNSTNTPKCPLTVEYGAVVKVSGGGCREDIT
ncbi:hypothetical protein SprV_0401460200 [Sparganum proliferum]